MNFLSFFKEIDNKRRKSKRIAINLLYLLLPLVILANSFTSDRIITECEEIDHYNTELQKEIDLITGKYDASQEEVNLITGKYNDSKTESRIAKENLTEEILELERERELIKLEIAVIDSQRLIILQGNGELAEEAQRYRSERDQERRRNENLEEELITVKEARNKLRDRANLCEAETQKLIAQATECDLSIENMNKNITALQNEKKDLETQLRNQISENTTCSANIKTLNRRITVLQNEKKKLEIQLSDQSSAPTEYEVAFSQVLDDSPAFSKPTEWNLETTVKYAVMVNGKTVTYVCPGECAN